MHKQEKKHKQEKNVYNNKLFLIMSDDQLKRVCERCVHVFDIETFRNFRTGLLTNKYCKKCFFDNKTDQDSKFWKDKYTKLYKCCDKRQTITNRNKRGIPYLSCPACYKKMKKEEAAAVTLQQTSSSTSSTSTIPPIVSYPDVVGDSTRYYIPYNADYQYQPYNNM